MTNSKLVFLAITSALLFQGCAHSALEKKVDNEVAQENAISTHAELRAETGKLILSAPGLTDAQRSQLTALRDSTRAQVDAMWAQSLKLRSVLIKDLIATNYSEDEVELIKKKIKDNEDKRLSVTFNAVEQANSILGHQSTDTHARIMDGFFEGHGSRD